MKKIFLCALCLLCSFHSMASAETMISESQYQVLESNLQELNQVVMELKNTVDSQKVEIEYLKSNQIRGSEPAQTAALPPVTSQGSRTLQGRWNPDVGVVADAVLSQDSPRSDGEGADRLSVRETELVFGSPVDPYSRLDATISFSDFEDPGLEEAYYTHFDIFGSGITGRLGRFKPMVGKAASVHRDSLDTVDEPLVVQHYFGLEGFNKSGADIARDIELPWAVTHRLTLGILEGGNGEGGTLFGETRRRPTIYTHLKNYADLNDSTGLEMGITQLFGSRDEDSGFESSVLGFDVTLIHHYEDQRHVKIQSEGYRLSRSKSFYSLEDPVSGNVTFQDLDDAKNLWGGYSLLDWRFDPRWAAGFRFDDLQLVETADNFANPDSHEVGYTGYLTFYQSEFARWRLQLTHVDLTNGEDDNRFFVQGTFAIGEHKHKLQ